MAKKRITHSVDPATIEENSIGAKERHTFAVILNRLMVEKGIDQEKMAEDLAISYGSISNYRNGKQDPKLTTIIKMADYLSVDCHYLMTGIHAQASLVSKDLGLSDESIGWLLAMNSEPNKESLQVLDRMLATDEFQYIISYIVYITKIFDEIKHGTIWSTLSTEERSVITAARKIFFEKDMYDIYSVELPEKAANAKQVLQSTFVDMVENLFFTEKEWGEYDLTTPVGTDSTLTK